MKPTIISLSGKAQHGKTTSCIILDELLTLKGKRCLQINYGDYVKDVAKRYYGWDGNKDLKGRTLLQQLGTEKIRSEDQTFWVDTVIRLINVIGKEFDYVLISDARFPDEVTRWKESGYNIITVHVDRPGFDNGLTEEQQNHQSETAMNGFEFNHNINAKDIFELRHKLTVMRGLI